MDWSNPKPREKIQQNALPAKQEESLPENEEIKEKEEEINKIQEKLEKAKKERKVLIGKEQKKCSHQNEVRVVANDVNFGKNTIQGWLCLDCGRYRPKLEGSYRKVCQKCGKPAMEFDREYHVAADSTKTDYKCKECRWTYGYT